jgi:deazaflavin-dependent oxidoreductase (nitroreductase family)
MRPTNFVNSLKKTRPSSSSKDNSFEREQYLYLTTRGRTSGRPREIEIWFTHHRGRFYIIAEYPTSHWVQNLKADPTASIRVQDSNFAVRSRMLTADEEPELHRHIQELSRQKYGWGDGLVVELAPETQLLENQ